MKQTKTTYFVQWIAGIITGFYCYVFMLNQSLNGFYSKINQLLGAQLFMILFLTVTALCTLPGILILKKLKLNALIYFIIGFLGISIFFIPLLGNIHQYLNAFPYFFTSVVSGAVTIIINRKSIFVTRD